MNGYKCSVKHCRQEQACTVVIDHVDYGLCQQHWEEHCEIPMQFEERCKVK